MARRLPANYRFPAIATDWSTGEVEAEVVYRRGRWWDVWTWEHHSEGNHRAYDRRKRERNLTLKRFLSTQSTDPGL